MEQICSCIDKTESQYEWRNMKDNWSNNKPRIKFRRI